MTYCQLDPWEQIFMKFEPKYNFQFENVSPKWHPFCSDLNVLRCEDVDRWEIGSIFLLTPGLNFSSLCVCGFICGLGNAFSYSHQSTTSKWLSSWRLFISLCRREPGYTYNHEIFVVPVGALCVPLVLSHAACRYVSFDTAHQRPQAASLQPLFQSHTMVKHTATLASIDGPCISRTP